jgi:hypothetical protein
MKAQKFLFVLAAVLFAGAGSAWAGGRVYGSVGVYVGPGAYWGPAYPRPYYYPRAYYPGFYPYLYGDPYYDPAPVVIVPSTPQVYIERSDAAAEPAENAAQQYWYFCKGSNKYYPYVKECPGGWQKVLPQPAQ